jgi:hypothetical protein
MKLKPSPAYQWYPKDILSSARVAEMTLAEEGAFRRALDFSWLNGSLPADPKKLATIIGKGCTVKIAIAVKVMFSEVDGRLTNDRLEACRIAQELFKKHKAEAGKNGANKRWQNDGTPNGTATDLPLAEGIANDSSSSSSATTLKEKGKKETLPPPTVDEVVSFFLQNGYTETIGRKAHASYTSTNWIDKFGAQVLPNWQKKMVAVWFKDEHLQPKQQGKPSYHQKHPNAA